MKKEIVCPYCHSEQITSNKKGYTTGTILSKGLLFGASDANKIIITCLMCGAKFVPGYGHIKTTNDTGEVTYANGHLAPQTNNTTKSNNKIILIASIIIILLIALGYFHSHH